MGGLVAPTSSSVKPLIAVRGLTAAYKDAVTELAPLQQQLREVPAA